MSEVQYEVRHEHGDHYVIASLASEYLFTPVKGDGATKLEAAEDLAVACLELWETTREAKP